MKDNKYNYRNQSGMYRHKITLKKQTVIQDEYLQDIETFVDYGSYWARLITLKGDEVNRAAQEGQEITKRFVIRFTERLRDFVESEGTSFIIIHKGLTYDVKTALNDDEMNETITIVAKTGGVNDGN